MQKQNVGARRRTSDPCAGRSNRVVSSLMAVALACTTAKAAAEPAPMMIQKQGAFNVGGRVIGDSKTSSLSCDHGYVEYQIPVRPRATSLMLWHSSSAQVWQNRWDGGEGFQSIFLRRRFPVYLWDGPRVGRANWSCEAIAYTPKIGQDQGNFWAWRFGPSFMTFYPGVQFPSDDQAAWERATRARYDEFDSIANAELQADAAGKAVDKIGPTVLVTNSAGGLRGLLTALKSDNVKAIVAYENVGFVFPKGMGPDVKPGPFGPIYVSLEQFRKFAKIPMQFVWGDHVDAPPYSEARALCRQFVEMVNAYGGTAEILDLTDVGLKGNTHLPFADLNNVAVADQMERFLRRHKLDR